MYTHRYLKLSTVLYTMSFLENPEVHVNSECQRNHRQVLRHVSHKWGQHQYATSKSQVATFLINLNTLLEKKPPSSSEYINVYMNFLSYVLAPKNASKKFIPQETYTIIFLSWTSFRANVFDISIFILRHALWIFALTKKIRFGLTNVSFQ
jgi:hypothetical protein